VADRLALFTGGVFADSHAKTAHGILRYGTREVVAVVDDTSAGAVASDVVPYARRAVPIVGSVAEAVKLGSNVLVIGVAPFGGALTQEWRAALLEAIGAGLSVEAGLHTVLAEDPQLSAAAAAAGVDGVLALDLPIEEAESFRGSLADYIDLDGHLLIANAPFTGLGLSEGRLVLSERAGLGVERSDG
jgi:uncharacterized NAD-dependent epimerase/dehydratase family protein